MLPLLVSTVLVPFPAFSNAHTPSQSDDGALAGRTAVEDGDGVRRLMVDGVGVLAWHHGYDPTRHEETYKPVLHLASPDGTVRLTKGTGGLYPHHRGLFLGWSEVSSGGRSANSWWSPEGRADRQELLRFLDIPGGLGAEVVWIADDGEAIARDERRLTLVEHDAAHTVLDVELRIHALASALLVLDGDPAHGGFQVRLRQEVAEREDCSYLRAVGAEPQGNDDWTACAWVAGTATIEGRTFAVAILDHPANPDGTVYNTRAYGRFGPFVRAEVAPGEPLILRYRVVVYDVEALGRRPDRSDYWSLAEAFRGQGSGGSEEPERDAPELGGEDG